MIQTAWTATAEDPALNPEQKRVFPADLVVKGLDRPELMRELFEILTRQGVHVIDLRKSVKKGLAQILLTVEVKDSEVLRVVQNSLEEVKGVTQVRRR